MIAQMMCLSVLALRPVSAKVSGLKKSLVKCVCHAPSENRGVS